VIPSLRVISGCDPLASPAAGDPSPHLKFPVLQVEVVELVDLEVEAQLQAETATGGGLPVAVAVTPTDSESRRTSESSPARRRPGLSPSRTQFRLAGEPSSHW